MVKKQNKKMTIAYWAKQLKTSPMVVAAITAENQLLSNSRITESEYMSMIDKWLGEPVRGQK